MIYFHCTFILLCRPFVEYKGTIPSDQLLTKQKELEIEANALIATGGKVSDISRGQLLYIKYFLKLSFLVS